LLLRGNLERKKIDGLLLTLFPDQSGHELLGLRQRVDIAEKDDLVLAQCFLHKLKRFRWRIAQQCQKEG
jgi:hypothetical protein